MDKQLGELDRHLKNGYYTRAATKSVFACLLSESKCSAQSRNVAQSLLESVETGLQRRQCVLCTMMETQTMFSRLSCEAIGVFDGNAPLPSDKFAFVLSYQFLREMG